VALMDNKKSMSYVNIYFPPFQGAGAVRAMSFLQFFFRKGFELTVYAPGNAVKEDWFKLIRVRAPLATNKNGMARRLFFEILYSCEVFFRILAGKKTEYAILSSPSFFVTFFSSIAFTLKGTKVIPDIRDLYPEVLFRLNVIKRRSPVGRVLIAMEGKLYRDAYKVLIANAYHSDNTKMLDPEKILQVRNGYNSDFFEDLGEKNTVFTVCYHGNLGKLYDVELLRKVIDRLNEMESGIQFLVIGKGAEDYLVRGKIKNLTYIAEVRNELIASYISKCHVGISTTRGNDFVRDIYPVKVFEYIGARVPSIVVPKGVSGKMVEENRFGFQFDNDELDLIVQKILELKNNKDLYQTIVQNLTEKRKLFTREAQLKKVGEVVV